MTDKNINIIHKFLNQEFDLDELKKQLSVEDFKDWEKTLAMVEGLPKSSFDTDKEFEILKNKINNKKQNAFKFKFAVAAILMIFFSYFIINIINSQPKLTTFTYNGTEKNNLFYLPDSSKVWLNSGASVSFSTKSWQTHRDLQLIGEGFFEVKKGKQFTVESNLGSVQVLGTSFLVSADNNIFAVTCYSGKVAVYHKNKKQILTSKMSFSSVNQMVKQSNANFPSFVGKWSMFDKTPLIEVIKTIETEKNITIDIKLNKPYLFSGGFSENMPTEDILNLICESLGVNYQIISTNKYEIINPSNP